MRKFSLKNSNGESLNLTTTECFFHEPSGLGFEREDSFLRVGPRYIRVNKTSKQKTIEGKIYLLDKNPYEQYKELMEFIQFEPLTLIYKPDDVSYRITCYIQKVEKTQREEIGHLIVPISFIAATPWYRTVDFNARTTKQTEPFPITWGWKWPYLKEVPMDVHVESDTVITSPCKIEIYGPIKNPSWTHYVDGKKVASGSYNVTVAKGQYLLIDGITEPTRIQLRNADDRSLISNEYQNSDFTTDRFVNVEYGTNRLKFSGKEDEKVDIDVEVRLYYESV